MSFLFRSRLSAWFSSALFVAAGPTEGSDGPVTHQNGPTTILHVDADRPAGGNGGSWDTAFRSPQDALAAAVSGDEIWVAEGVYSPGKARGDTFHLKSNVAVYGGFAGTETLRGERDPDPASNGTVLSGELGDPGDRFDNTFNVVTASGADDAVLSGFLISDGCAGSSPSDTSFDARGGAFSIHNCTATFINCLIAGNEATFANGGGIHADTDSHLELINCTIASNVSTSDGGGITKGWRNLHDEKRTRLE